MKTIKHLFTALLLLCVIVATAHDFEVDGIYYNITDAAKKTVAVTSKGSAYSNEYTGNVVIPEFVTYNGTIYGVTSIGGFAFEGCTGLTSVVIPNSVTSIGVSAFNDCTSLKTLCFEDGIETLNLGYNQSDNVYLYHSGLFFDCPLDTLYLGRNISYRDNQYYGYSPFYYKTKKEMVEWERKRKIAKRTF